MRELTTRVALAVLVGIGMWWSPVPGSADDGANGIGTCLGSGQVWLLVTTEDGDALANQCVGTPASGLDALAAGGMKLELSKGGLVCTIGGHPEDCPRTFTGTYWAYYQGAPGQDYHYSDEGAGTAVPRPGTIEAWCYNKPTEERCSPPQLHIAMDGSVVAPPAGEPAKDLAVTHNAAVDLPSGTPWPTIVVVALGVIGFAGIALWRRRATARPGPRGH